MYRIYIVEDDPIISAALSDHFSGWGYSVKTAVDFNAILTETADFMPHLILLDLSLPFYNGYYWCQEIRKLSKVPIVFISSAADRMNIIMAMEKGADDYISKPFDIDILSAKLQALLRRTYQFETPADLLEYRNVVLSMKEMTLNYQEKKVVLTRNEFKILQILMENKKNAVSREDIMVKLWENDSYVDDNTLTVNINRLRNKLQQLGIADFIVTKKGIGYMVI